MSRKMIDYQTSNGMISSIDGYKVGEELHFKTIYICTTRPYSANSEANVQSLNDGTWFTIQSGAIDLTNTLTSEEKEIIRKAKQLIVIPTAGKCNYGDGNPTGTIITQAVDAEITHPDKQGYYIFEQDGKIYLAARSVSRVYKAAPWSSMYKEIHLTIACVIVAIY